MLQSTGMSIRSHGRRSLELKVEHQLGSKKESWYRTRVIFFFPRSLVMTEERVSRIRWYANLQAYLRLHPPATSLYDLAKAQLDHDPEEAIKRGVIEGRRASKKLRRMHRLHAQKMRDAMRLRREQVISDIQSLGDDAALESINEFARELVSARQKIQTPAKELGLNPDSKLGRLIQRCDEWTSLEASAQILQVMYATQTAGMVIPQACHHLLDAEDGWRSSMGYPSQSLDKAWKGSDLLMRMSRLKKMVGSALYLELSTEAPSHRVRDIAFAIAASVAMLWAVGMQLVTWWFVGNPTSPDAAPSTIAAFTLTAVLAYAMKDKIKEGLRGWFTTRIPSWLFDRKQVGLDDDDEELAAAQESTRFVRLKELSAADQRWYQDSKPLELPVDTLVYERLTTLKGDRLREGQPDMAGLTEIVRFALRPWLTHMDNLRQPMWNRNDEGAIEQSKSVRMYPIVMLVELNRPQKKVKASHRIYISQRGLERIDLISEH
jgi:hypothetical protein